MTDSQRHKDTPKVSTLAELAQSADYTLLNNLVCDPDATDTGEDHAPRQVYSGHYVPVKPMPLPDPHYVAHSPSLFEELGWNDQLAQTEDFRRLFSGDVSVAPAPMQKMGWATGYALSIYGIEYTQQCPFQTGNGYGDGRAISVLEGVFNDKRWEMQLKGGGRTPYCRGGDGRAVLRSSIREFLAQEHMHALGVPTSRSLSLYVSQTERVNRPWYSEGAHTVNPDILQSNPVAISTRVAPSFLRVGQLELFGRRVRQQTHADTLQELTLIAEHVIEREYHAQIDAALPLPEKLVLLATEFRDRLTSLIAHWLRVGYCQGNFNSDNCAVGGFTLDYGPFGFCERFDPLYQPWTGGGQHFYFFNQAEAADINFHMFWTALRPLLAAHPDAQDRFDAVRKTFSSVMREKLEHMWAAKLGLTEFNYDLFSDLITLMTQTGVDYTIFFRDLCTLPDNVLGLQKAFYNDPTEDLDAKWADWLKRWRTLIGPDQNPEILSENMRAVNPKYTWREWLIAPAYQLAEKGDFTQVHALHNVLTQPYATQTPNIEDKYYRLQPEAIRHLGGVAHYSCSS